MGNTGTEKKKAKKKMSIPARIIFFAALAVFIVSAAVLIRHYGTDLKAQHDFTKLQVNGSHDLEALYKKNHDLAGWVKVEDTRIDYPVMQTPGDPEYYLRRNFEKNYSIAGTPFLDADSRIGKSKNYLIYGHNIKSGTMFHQLLKYEDEKFYEKHKTFTYDQVIDGKQVDGTYRVIAVFRSRIYPKGSDRFRYYAHPSITDRKTYDEYVSSCRKISSINTGVSARWGQQLMTLSTCAYHVKDGRFAVVGVKVDE